jgi:uncharacterized membrane protein (DUF2068 family)
MASKKGLRMIAIAEGTKGALVLLVGLGLARMAIGDQALIAEQIVEQFHLNPANRLPHIFLVAANSSDARLYMFAAAAAFYSAVRFAEMWGLWFERRWAEWLGAFSGSLYVPVEVYELWHRPSWIKAGTLTLNVAVVAYLLWILWSRREAKVTPVIDQL